MAANSVMKQNPLFVSSKSTDTSACKFSLLLPFSGSGGNTLPDQIRAAQARRSSANYQPNAWTLEFLDSSETGHMVEKYKNKVSKLKAEVKHMIIEKKTDMKITLRLIDEVEKLGLGYLYATEIRTALDRFVTEEGGFNFNDIQNNLYATALAFRILRQHGYNVSAEVFSEFKNEEGNFKEWVKEDIEGMMSLYEASYVGFPGETILDEANLFTKSHLKEIKGNLSKDVDEQIDHMLELPFHRRVQRVEAEWNIRAYSKRQDANKVLLELGAMDFNMVQSFFRRDLQDVSRWWKRLGLTNKLSFARDRLMECFFWAVGMVFQPQYSNCTKALAKVGALITTIDDVYDVYGTLEELELFTDAVVRWDVDTINHLSDCMKLCFFALYNTVNEMVYEILKEKGENVLPYLRKAWGEMCKAFLQEAKWFQNKYTPSYHEYVENGWKSSSGPLILVHAYFFLNDDYTKEELRHIQSYHNLLCWPSLIFRFANDLGSSTDDSKRGETAKSILCFMNDNGVCEERAKEMIADSIDEIWKKMNKEKICNTCFSKPFIDTTFNLARIVHCTYQYGDVHSAPNEISIKRILSVIVEPISLEANSKARILKLESTLGEDKLETANDACPITIV